MKTLIAFMSLTTISFAQQIEVTTPKYVMPDSITIANGTKISREEFIRRCNIAWDNSFGKMTKEENDLLFGVPIMVTVEGQPKKTAITPHSSNE